MPDVLPEKEQPSSPPSQGIDLPDALQNTTILTAIFGVLLFSVIGMGTAVVLTWNRQEPPPAPAPTPTPTPDPRVSWKDYTSDIYGITMKLPPDWKIQEGGGSGDSTLYLHSNESFGNLRYYVYITSIANPENASISARLEQEYSLPLSLKEEKIEGKTFSLTTAAPSRQGSLTAFLEDTPHNRLLSFALTPYDGKRPLREQERYDTIFRQILSTVKVVASGSALPVPFGQGDHTASQSSSLWKIYADRRYPFTLEYPPEYMLDTSRQGRVVLGDHIEIVATSVDPRKCKGVCPVREKERSLSINKYNAKKYEGYLTSEGGQTPQRYLQYVFYYNKLYYMFTLYELPFNTTAPKNRTPELIDLSLITTFDELINSIRFTR